MSDTPRVLFFSPYASWNFHTGLEITWAHAMRLRGVDTRVTLCDGLLPACDVYRHTVNPRKANSCVQCQARTAHQFAQLNMPYDWLGTYVPRRVRQVARDWADGLAAGDLLSAEWRGRPLGRWAATSAYYQFRTCHLDLDDPLVVQTVRDLLVGSALTVEALTVLLDEYRPDVLVTLNGRFFSHWAAVELAQEKGIRLVTHERGLRKNTIRFADGHRTHELAPMEELWERWRDVPLDEEELARVLTYLQDRCNGKNYSFLVFSPSMEEARAAASIREQLSLDDSPVVAVFSSSDDETAAFPDRTEGAFPDSRDFLPAVLELAARRPQVQFVVRMHPNIQSILGTNRDQLQHARDIRARAGANVRVVMPDDPVSTYALMDEASVGIVYGSTAGLELATTGKPVLCASRSTYLHTGCVTPVREPAELEPALDAALEAGPSRETARLALRWAARYFDHFSMPFDLVHEEPQHQAKLQYNSLAALQPGANKGLDHVCSMILGAESIVPKPTAEQLARNTAIEDTFLEAWVPPQDRASQTSGI